MTDSTTRAREAVLRFIPDTWDPESIANFEWRLDQYRKSIEDEVRATVIEEVRELLLGNSAPVDALYERHTRAALSKLRESE